jgi:hypothetical protein
VVVVAQVIPLALYRKFLAQSVPAVWALRVTLLLLVEMGNVLSTW